MGKKNLDIWMEEFAKQRGKSSDESIKKMREKEKERRKQEIKDEVDLKVFKKKYKDSITVWPPIKVTLYILLFLFIIFPIFCFLIDGL